jgi:hypothetical protein
MKKKHFAFIFASALFFSQTTFAIPIELAVNGSFEIDDIPANSMVGPFPFVTGWSGVGFLMDGQPQSFWPTSGNTGSQYADFGNNPTVVGSQTFTVPLEYEISEISWYTNTGNHVPSTTYTVELLDGLGGILLSEDFSVIGSISDWTSAFLDISVITLGSGSYTFSIYGTAGVGQADVLIDDVSFVARLAPQQVPAPPTLWLLAPGIVMVLRKRINRRG